MDKFEAFFFVLLLSLLSVFYKLKFRLVWLLRAAQ